MLSTMSFSLHSVVGCSDNNTNTKIYLSRVKYIITDSPVVYIVALNKTKHKNINLTYPTNYYTSN